jgi:glycosyltransferase involved in cell wall biosynthesis
VISIIIPVYNRVDKLANAIKSIQSQTYADLQIIIVDDGSDDGSEQLADELASHDRRIVVIHQKNRGVSAARNMGIQAAQGEWIAFVDSDDQLSPHMYETLLGAIEKSHAGVVICGMDFRYYNSQNRLERTEIMTHPAQLLTDDLRIVQEVLALLKGSLIHSPCNKLYQTSIIKNQISFPDEVALGEDLLFNLNYLKHIHSLEFVPDCLYVYHNDMKGAVAKYRENKHDIMTRLYHGVLDFVGSENYVDLTAPLYVKWTYSCFIDLFAANCPLSKKDKLHYVKSIMINPEVQQAAKNCPRHFTLYRIMSQAILSDSPKCVYYLAHMMYLIKFRWVRVFQHLHKSISGAR